MNYYELFQITPDASPEIIKAAYKALAKKYHPDVCGDNGKMMTQINEAYAVLSDPLKRREYDREINSHKKEDNSSSKSTSETPKSKSYSAKRSEYYHQKAEPKPTVNPNTHHDNTAKSDDEMPMGCLGWIVGSIALLIEGILYVLEFAWGIVLLLIIIGFFTGHSQKLFGSLFDWVTNLIK